MEVPTLILIKAERISIDMGTLMSFYQSTFYDSLIIFNAIILVNDLIEQGLLTTVAASRVFTNISPGSG